MSLITFLSIAISYKIYAYDRIDYNVTLEIMFNAIMRPMWGFFICCIVYATTQNYGGKQEQFLCEKQNKSILTIGLFCRIFIEIFVLADFRSIQSDILFFLFNSFGSANSYNELFTNHGSFQYSRFGKWLFCKKNLIDWSLTMITVYQRYRHFCNNLDAKRSSHCVFRISNDRLGKNVDGQKKNC